MAIAQRRFGVSDLDGISSHLKIFIKQGDAVVVGYIGEGTSKELEQMWDEPLEGDSVGGRTGDFLQMASGGSAKTELSSTLIWQGGQPFKIQATIYFKAYANAKNEVDDAIMMLEQFASPELSSYVGIGSSAIPEACSVNVGRRLILPKCYLFNVGSELSNPRTKNGYMLHNTVTTTISTQRIVNKSEIPSLYS